jgi:hypothetical protein
MPVLRLTQYKCDVPSCPIVFEGENQPPKGWINLSSESVGYDDGCDCECHSCAAGDEMEVAGHDEEDCSCQKIGDDWQIVLCPNHSEELKRRFR